MGIILFFVIVTIVSTVVTHIVAGEIKLVCKTFFSTSGFGVAFCGIWVFFSWANYMLLEQDIIRLKTHEAEIKIYIEKGVAEFDKVDAKRTITDLKYQSYQKELSDKLYRMRKRVNKYNNNLIGKLVLIRNWIVGPTLTVLPRNTGLYKMGDAFDIPIVIQ